jgi:hypothetical protein
VRGEEPNAQLQRNVSFPLTPALSLGALGEREDRFPRGQETQAPGHHAAPFDKSRNGGDCNRGVRCFPTRGRLSPLP